MSPQLTVYGVSNTNTGASKGGEAFRERGCSGRGRLANAKAPLPQQARKAALRGSVGAECGGHRRTVPRLAAEGAGPGRLSGLRRLCTETRRFAAPEPSSPLSPRPQRRSG